MTSRRLSLPIASTSEGSWALASAEGSIRLSDVVSGALGAVPRVGALSRCFFFARARLAFDFDFAVDFDFARVRLVFDPPDALLRCSAITHQTIDERGGSPPGTVQAGSAGRRSSKRARIRAVAPQIRCSPTA